MTRCGGLPVAVVACVMLLGAATATPTPALTPTPDDGSVSASSEKINPLGRVVFTSDFIANVSDLAATNKSLSLEFNSSKYDYVTLDEYSFPSVLYGHIEIINNDLPTICGVSPVVFDQPTGVGIWWWDSDQPLGTAGGNLTHSFAINPCLLDGHKKIFFSLLAQVVKGRTFAECVGSDASVSGRVTLRQVYAGIIGESVAPFPQSPTELGGPVWSSRHTTDGLDISQMFWQLDLSSVASAHYNLSLTFYLPDHNTPKPWPFDGTDSIVLFMPTDHRCPLFSDAPMERFPSLTKTWKLPNSQGTTSIGSVVIKNISISTKHQKKFNLALWKRAGASTKPEEELLVSATLVKTSDGGSKASKTGLAVGLSLGGIAIIAIVFAVVYFKRRRSNYSQI